MRNKLSAVEAFTKEDMNYLMEGIEKKTRYARLVICSLMFVGLLIYQVRFSGESVAASGYNPDVSTIRGVFVQLQMLITVYLVLKENKPGFYVSLTLNASGLLGSVAFMIVSGTSLSLPGVIAYSSGLALVFLINAYHEKIKSHLAQIKEQAKRDSFFSSVFEQAPIGIAIVRGKTILGQNEQDALSINPSFERILGRDKGRLQGINWMDITHPNDLAADLSLFEKFRSGSIDRYQITKRFIKPDGGSVWVDMQVSPFIGAQGRVDEHICIITDVSQRRQIEEALKYNDEHVLLTGLYNRKVLERTLHQDALDGQAGKRALLLVNLSGLDVLSMRYGFHYNQEMIKKAADTLYACMGDDTELYQSFENRFVFYIKGYKDRLQLDRFGEKVSAALIAILSPFGIRHSIGAIEIDLAGIGDADEGLKNLLLTSEYAARESGDDRRVLYWGADIEARVNRKNDISRALSDIISGQDEGRLHLYFQPIWDAVTQRVYAYEALARLKLDGYGMIPPDEFISIAEKDNMIIPLGDILIRKTLGFMQKLRDKGLGMMAVSVNVSLIQLLSHEFAQNLIHRIRLAGINPAYVVVELTESVFSDKYDVIKQAIGILKSYGIRIMIDDFGTGYSSLERHSELDVDCIKIDKIFVDRLRGSSPELTIVPDIISMAHKLGHCVVAEGVESEEQLNSLLACGCDKIQGYLISRPLDEAAALSFQYSCVYDKDSCEAMKIS